ncbi:MAG: hypothetical protein PUH91_11150 [Prevotella sp.]|nr:hypothetical protein [Prevotella sp.]
MEEQIVTIKVVTTGEICEMSNDEIIEWYQTNIGKLFNPDYGTPQITVNLERNALGRE